MIQIAFCDDNIQELSNMNHYIAQYCIDRNLNCEFDIFSNGLDLIASLEAGKNYDLYVLDILMPGLTGMDLAKEIRIRNKHAILIFLTSSPEFALESYTVKATNYVLKPLTQSKFYSVFDDLMESLETNHKENVLLVKSDSGIQKILISNLVYAEVIGRTVHYHIRPNRTITCIESFSALCDRLLEFGCFVQTHRSYIINMQYVDIIDNKQVTLQTRAAIPIAQGKAKKIRQQYLSYQMNEH